MNSPTNTADWVVREKSTGRIVSGPTTLEEAEKAQSQLTESTGSGPTEVVQLLNG